jgi:hypothetical protein
MRKLRHTALSPAGRKEGTTRFGSGTGRRPSADGALAKVKTTLVQKRVVRKYSYGE